MPDTQNEWPALPTETEIYILPNGEIVVADLPVELAAHLDLLTKLQTITSVEEADASHVTNQQHPTQPTEPS